LRILYAPDRKIVLESLQRNHVVALLNFAHRLSESISAIEMMHPLVTHHEPAALYIPTATEI
jgi:hypothetical protein